MNYRPFPNEYWNKIEQTIQKQQAQNSELIAAFDADGTLWDIDLGETFFQFQIDQKQVELPADPWNHYFDLKKVNNDPRPAYVWLAQINKNKSLQQVKAWAQQSFDLIKPNPIFQEQKKLIDLFKKNNVKVYIVTASIKWAVEPGARALGLHEDDVIGVETKVVNGIITDEAVYPITFRQGKVDALLNQTKNKKPFFCSGNTIGDFELLNCATDLKLAVSAASRDDRLFKSENELLQKASDNGWWGHRFI